MKKRPARRWGDARTAAVAFAVLALVSGGAWVVSPAAFDPDAAPAQAAALAAPAQAVPSGPLRPVMPGPGDPARLFDIGASGDLRIDLTTKSALDLILSDLGPSPTPAALAAVEHSLRSGLPREAADQAVALLASYRAYLQAQVRLVASHRSPSSVEDMRSLLAREAALRGRHFDRETDEALFGVQAVSTRFWLDAQAIENDPYLSPGEKATGVDALRVRLPAEYRDVAPERTGAVVDVEHRVLALRADGGSAVQVQALRTRYLGADAAAQLGELEADREASPAGAAHPPLRVAMLADPTPGLTGAGH